MLAMRFFSLFVCLILSFHAIAQTQTQSLYTRAQLEAKRKEISEQIHETEQQLYAIKKDKNATMAQLRALQNKLSQRQNLISTINDEMDDINKTIQSSSKEVGSLKQKLEQLKVRYAQSIRYAYETRSSYDMMAFLFSSADFNDAMRRMKYLKWFREFRKEQVEQIRLTQAQLQHKIGALNTEKAQKEELVQTQVQQKQELLKETDQTNLVINELKGKEGKLMKDIEKNRQINNRIDKAIQTYIEREMAEAEKRGQDAEKRAAANSRASEGKTAKTTGNEGEVNLPRMAPKPKAPRPEAPTLLLTPTDEALASNFEGNKGKLYWPVEKGYITDHFGTHPHPLAPKVMIENSGIDIQTTEGAQVHAVFDGTVTSVFSIGGSQQIVMIQHGNYCTVYNNMETVSVKKGQQVTTRQVIGIVGKNEESSPTINFQIWKYIGKNKTLKMNPEVWLGRAR
jgi:septal ring factor EnvC (AmiA/AmiB activator)